MMVCFGIFWPLKRPFGLFCPLLVLKKTEKNFLLVNHVNVSFIPVVLEFLLNAQNRFIVLHKQNKCTVFENHRKSLELSLQLHFEQTKVPYKCHKWSILVSLWKPEICGQTVLPDRSISIGQKLVENAKIENLKCDILGDFQTLCAFTYCYAGVYYQYYVL